MGYRFVLIASLVLFLIATFGETSRLPVSADPTPPPTEHSTLDTLIVSGTRVGPITLGLSVDHMRKILGDGQLRPQGLGMVHLYSREGLAIYSQNERIFSVTVRSPVFKTRSGVGVGSDVDQVLKTLSGDYEMEGSGRRYKLHNWSEGWHLEVNGDKVDYIQITTKLTEGPKLD